MDMQRIKGRFLHYGEASLLLLLSTVAINYAPEGFRWAQMRATGAYYSFPVVCSNCGKQNTTFLPKGSSPVNEFDACNSGRPCQVTGIECHRCGRKLTFTSHDISHQDSNPYVSK